MRLCTLLALLLTSFFLTGCGYTSRKPKLTEDGCPDWEMSESARYGKDESSLTTEDRAGMKAWHDCEKAKMIADGCVVTSDDGNMTVAICPGNRRKASQ